MSNKQVLLVCGSARRKYNVYLEKQNFKRSYCCTEKEQQFFCKVEQLKSKKSLSLTRNHCWLLQIVMMRRLNMVIS